MKTSKPHFFHCATKGFTHNILFIDEREYIAGMNRMAFCRARLMKDNPVIIIAFCLMDNHLHIILYGLREDCLKWMALYHRLTMMWQSNHRSGNPVDEPWVYDAWQIWDENDLKEKIAYVFRNPMAAGQALVPTNYRWSSAGLVFTNGCLAGGRKIGELSSFQFRKLFDTRISLPEDWIVMPDGLIWPGSYTDSRQVEKCFGQPASFLYALNQKIEAKVNQEMLGKELSLPDQDVVRIASEESKNVFGIQDVTALDFEQRIVLCTLLRKRSGITLKQLGRVFHISPEDMKRIFGK